MCLHTGGKAVCCDGRVRLCFFFLQLCVAIAGMLSPLSPKVATFSNMRETKGFKGLKTNTVLD